MDPHSITIASVLNAPNSPPAQPAPTMDPHSITLASIMNPPDEPPAQPAPAKRSFSEFAEDNNLPAPRLVLLHADALIDGRKALTYTIGKVISLVSPKTKRPTDAEILATVRRTPNLTEIYRSLGAIAAHATEAKEWCLRHRNIMKRARPKMLGVYPEAEPFLQCLHAHRIPVLLLASALDKVEAVAKDWTFKHLIAGSVGQAHTFLENKDQFANVIKTVFSPWIAKHDLASDAPLDMTMCDKYEPAPLQPEEIMVVSCCQYNLVVAQQLGVQTCWIRMGDASVRGGCDTESVVDDLDGLTKIIKECEPKKKMVSKSKSASQMDIADEAGPSNKNDQEGAEEASARPVHETQQDTTESQAPQDIKSPLVKCEPEGSAEPVEEIQNPVKCEPEGSPKPVKKMQPTTLDEDVVMLDAADGEEEPISTTEALAVKNIAAGDQPNDMEAPIDYVTSINDAASNNDEETEARDQVSRPYEDHKSPHTPEAATSSPKQVFTSPDIPSSQTTTFLGQIPSSPPAIYADNFSEQLDLINESRAATEDLKDNHTQDNNQMSNATIATDSTLSDVLDLSD